MPTVTTRIQPIDRDLVIRLTGTPQERSALHAQFAREKLAEAEEVDRQIIGAVPSHQTFVDGSSGVSEDRVRPDGGVIVYEFELVSGVLAWISDTLETHSPVGAGHDPHPGRYKHSHVMLADGALADPSNPPPAEEYVFVNSEPYARKIERGASQQFPDGVYQAVAALARARFGNSAKITFDYRSIAGGEVGAWAAGASAQRHAGRHRRQANPSAWLTAQPVIIVSLR
jgi:hypothetical protein